MTTEDNRGKSKGIASEIRLSAMNLLARREHSHRELQQKLQKRFGDSDLIASVIERLASQNLQSDERFAESFLSARKRNGQGPVRIAMELEARGLAEELIREYVNPREEQWIELARHVWRKRFGSMKKEATISEPIETNSFEVEAQSRKLRAKQMRFLQYRGFTTDQISKVLNDEV